MSKLNELLKEQQFNEDEIKNINEAIGKSYEWMPKAEWNKVNEENKTLKTRVEESEKQFKELEKKVGDGNEDLKAQLETMKKERDDAKKDAAEKIKSFERKSNCVKHFADKVYDVDDVYNKLDLDKITFNEKNEPVDGLDDQINTMKETRPNYFKNDVGDNGSITTHKPKNNDGEGRPKEPNSEETYVSQYILPDGNENNK